jgi:prephenate dehydratase
VHSALIPLEHSSRGAFAPGLLDRIASAGLHVSGEVEAVDVHCLAAPVGLAVEDVTEIYSHPFVLMQVSIFPCFILLQPFRR